MKNIYPLSVLILLSMLWTGCQKHVPQKQTALKDVSTYATKHFSIDYPITFKAKYSKDEGYFTSPDGTVTFYAYSVNKPSGKNHYMKVKPSEKKLSSNSEKKDVKGAYYDYQFSGWGTFKAKNNSYYRAYTAKKKCNTKGKDFYGNCRFEIFGIRYKNEEAYRRYRDDFMLFKHSIGEC